MLCAVLWWAVGTHQLQWRYGQCLVTDDILCAVFTRLYLLIHVHVSSSLSMDGAHLISLLLLTCMTCIAENGSTARLLDADVLIVR